MVDGDKLLVFGYDSDIDLLDPAAAVAVHKVLVLGTDVIADSIDRGHEHLQSNKKEHQFRQLLHLRNAHTVLHQLHR